MVSYFLASPLQQEGFVCAVIDPQTRGTTLREDQWYAGTIKRLIGDLYLESAINFPKWWKELDAQSISVVERFDYFIEQVLLPNIPSKIAIFIEEVDNLLSLKFDTDGFFILIRSLYERRAEKPEYQRLTFAFLGVATPTDLIRGKGSSAFNIGHAVEMSGFTLQEAEPLARGLGDRVNDPQALLAAILNWTGGQPFLTQKLLTLIAAEAEAGQISPDEFVSAIAHEKVIENWEAQDIPAHLKTIRDRILQSDERGRGRLLGLYQQVVDSDGIPADESYDQMQLRLTGLVVKRDGRLIVNNQIYGAVFNQAWVSRALGDLRPSFYGSAFQAWQESDEQKESFLLRGQALVDAEAWAKGKRLSDEDDQFLRDSREVEKQAIARSLASELLARESAEQANLILAEAEREARESAEESNRLLVEAKQKAAKQIRSGSIILIFTLGAALLIAILAEKFVSSATQRADKSILQADKVIQQAERTIRSKNTQNEVAENKVKLTQVQYEAAKQNLARAKENLANIDRESKEQLDKANQEVQDAELRVSQALQEQQQAQKAVEEQISKSQAEAQKIQSEIVKKATEFSKLSVEFEQVQNQVRLAQQAIIENVGDAPARIESQTGQRPAIFYISFISSDNNLKEDDALGILMITSEGQISKQIPINRIEFYSLLEDFRGNIQDPTSDDFFIEAKSLYKVLIEPVEIELQRQKINNLVFITDDLFLRTIPLNALYDGEKFLIEKYSIGQMPGLTLTDTRHTDLKTANILAMGLSKAKDVFVALPDVEKQLSNIKSEWGNRVDVLLDEDFTLENFKSQRQKKSFQIVHIASQGTYVDSKQGAFFLMWDRRIYQKQFEELDLEKAPIELLIINASQSVVGSRIDNGVTTKFGLAGKAIQLGVKSVIATLWGTLDISETALMTEFYKHLKTAPTKSEALRLAQLALLKDVQHQNFNHPWHWASYTIIGNPW